MPNNSSNPNTPINPLKVIIQATKAVPFVKYALGLAGIAGTVAIILSFGLSPKIGFLGILITLPLMFILFLFAKISQAKFKLYRRPAIVLMWAVVILFIFVMTSLSTSVFF